MLAYCCLLCAGQTWEDSHPQQLFTSITAPNARRCCCCKSEHEGDRSESSSGNDFRRDSSSSSKSGYSNGTKSTDRTSESLPAKTPTPTVAAEGNSDYNRPQQQQAAAATTARAKEAAAAAPSFGRFSP
ncbi:hypothetical protein ACSSS7_006954 [Eimeria intestinalis]